MATRAKTTKAKRTTKARKLPAAMAARAKAAREMTPAQKKAWVAKMAAAKAAKGTPIRVGDRIVAGSGEYRSTGVVHARGPSREQARHPLNKRGFIFVGWDGGTATWHPLDDATLSHSANPPAKGVMIPRKAKAKLSSWVVVKVGSYALDTFAAQTEAEALEAAFPADGDALTIYRGVKAVDAAAARLPAAYNKAKDVTRGKWSER